MIDRSRLTCRRATSLTCRTTQLSPARRSAESRTDHRATVFTGLARKRLQKLPAHEGERRLEWRGGGTSGGSYHLDRSKNPLTGKPDRAVKGTRDAQGRADTDAAKIEDHQKTEPLIKALECTGKTQHEIDFRKSFPGVLQRADIRRRRKKNTRGKRSQTFGSDRLMKCTNFLGEVPRGWKKKNQNAARLANA